MALDLTCMNDRFGDSLWAQKLLNPFRRVASTSVVYVLSRFPITDFPSFGVVSTIAVTIWK